MTEAMLDIVQKATRIEFGTLTVALWGGAWAVWDSRVLVATELTFEQAVREAYERWDRPYSPGPP